jgi:hypothetical protein
LSDGDIVAHLLIKPWYQTVTWNRSHFFSSKGNWALPGGDYDGSQTFNGTVVGSTIQFDIRDYFRNVATYDSLTHFGFLIKSSGALNQVILASVQYTNPTERPRVVASYTGTCFGVKSNRARVQYLGAEFKGNQFLEELP